MKNATPQHRNVACCGMKNALRGLFWKMRCVLRCPQHRNGLLRVAPIPACSWMFCIQVICSTSNCVVQAVCLLLCYLYSVLNPNLSDFVVGLRCVRIIFSLSFPSGAAMDLPLFLRPIKKHVSQCWPRVKDNTCNSHTPNNKVAQVCVQYTVLS